jgi:hypothetical protein
MAARRGTAELAFSGKADRVFEIAQVHDRSSIDQTYS